MCVTYRVVGEADLAHHGAVYKRRRYALESVSIDVVVIKPGSVAMSRQGCQLNERTLCRYLSVLKAHVGPMAARALQILSAPEPVMSLLLSSQEEYSFWRTRLKHKHPYQSSTHFSDSPSRATRQSRYLAST